VDECRWPFRDRLWCHLVSDVSYAELHEFARRLGIPRVAFQGDHYDLHEQGRADALQLGATPVDSRVLIRSLKAAGLRRGPEFHRNGLSAVLGLPAPKLTTQRLILRQWRPEDLDFLYALDRDPEVMRLIGGIRSAVLTESQMNRDAVGLALRGIGKWAVELRATGELIGRVGLTGADPLLPFTPALEFGVRFASKFHRNGFGHEAGSAALHYATEVLEATEVFGLTTVANVASQQLMKKLNMQYFGQLDHPRFAAGDPLAPHLVFRYAP
jgi:RimJ/RimL family protein N-acetyltransferase